MILIDFEYLAEKETDCTTEEKIILPKTLKILGKNKVIFKLKPF